MPTLNERKNEVIETFADYEDWLDKYQYLIDLGAELEPITEDEKNEKTLITGCQSQVWIICEQKEGRVHYRADSDAIIVKGIVALLINTLNGATAEEIVKEDFDFINKIGLMEHLSPTRSNGVVSMIHRIKEYALAFESAQKA